MKRMIWIVAVSLLLSLGCAGCTPPEWDSEAYEIGQKGLDILKKLNKGEIAADDAADLLDSFAKAAKKVSERIDQEVGSTDLKAVWASSVHSYLYSCARDLKYGNYDSLSMEREFKDLLASRR